MVWRRVLAPESVALRELHGILQVSMGWDGAHLYYFDIHAVATAPLSFTSRARTHPFRSSGFVPRIRFAYLYREHQKLWGSSRSV